MEKTITLIKKVWAILRNEQWEILIFEERLNDGKYHYTIPKGTFEKEKDSSLTEAVKREIFEETGLTDIELSVCHDCYPKYYEEYTSLLILFHGSVSGSVLPHGRNQENYEDICNHHFLSRDTFLTLTPERFADERMYHIVKEAFGIV